MARDTNLVWIDLEMTGLDPQRDVILEIATIITDRDLNVLEEGPELVIRHPREVLAGMEPVVHDMHERSGLIDAVLASKTTRYEAEQETLAVIKRHCVRRTGLLCGNSIWQDRAFLVRGMPTLIDYLHYRMIDVTSVKELVMRWYGGDPQVGFLKKDNHRAMTDIQESIAELKHYRKHFFVPRD